MYQMQMQAVFHSGCGTQLKLGHLKMVDSSHGDWQTENVSLENRGDNRNYIKVSSSHQLNPNDSCKIQR